MEHRVEDGPIYRAGLIRGRIEGAAVASHHLGGRIFIAAVLMLITGLALGYMVGVTRAAPRTDTDTAGSGLGSTTDAQAPGLMPASDVSDGLELRDVPPASDIPDVELGTAIESGIASFVSASYGPSYLALPGGPGIRVRICDYSGSRCVTRTSTDAGPDLSMQRAGRVADMSYSDFRTLCACTPEAIGLIPVMVEYLGAGPTPPSTDVEP